MKLCFGSVPARDPSFCCPHSDGVSTARGNGVMGLVVLLACGVVVAAPNPSADPEEAKPQSHAAHGVVKEVKVGDGTVVINHDAIQGYMAAMTMPFRVKEPDVLEGIQAGDEVTFCLHVTSTESWVDNLVKTGKARRPVQTIGAAALPVRAQHPLLSYHFTNELGRAVSLSDFRGQALAITFFFTRCPIPDYCPRLSKNFQQAAQKLAALHDAPTNWHFLSVSFDPAFDTPAVLRTYAQRYQYDPGHWSFLTGPQKEIGELASQSDVNFKSAGGFYSHNFRTLVIDANGKLQMMFPVGGDLADALVQEMLKAATVARRPGATEPAGAVATAGQ